MQDKLTKQLPWVLAHLIWFLVLPMAANFFPEDTIPAVLMLILMLANPIFCAVTGLTYSLRGNRSWLFLLYPVVGWIGTLFIYFNSSAWVYAVLGIFCGFLGLIFGRWAYNRKKSEAEKWVENQKPVKKAAPSGESAAAARSTASDYAPRVASKTAMKNQQKAAARKAKERAEKEEKIRQKNAPKKKKKKKGGH